MTVTSLFKINGQPMLAPDSGVGFAYEDLDGDGSGRDESGLMHREVLRYKVGTYSFAYAGLTEAERQYCEGLFPAEPTFQFTRPSRADSSVPETVEAYCSKRKISWRNAVTGLWDGYGFNIIEV